jgi:hypothetical protein
MHSQDSKAARDHAQTPSPKQNVPITKDGKTKIATGANPAACATKPDDRAIVTKTVAPALPSTKDNRDGTSEVTNEASSSDLISPVSSWKDWDKDQIHLGVDTNMKEESRNETSESSSAGSDLKCTTRQAVPKTAPISPN